MQGPVVIITKRVRCTEMIDLLGRMWKERSRIFQGFSLVGGAGGEFDGSPRRWCG
jgi:hypothetical protein